LNINISNSSGQPIYEQIVNQIKSLIITSCLNEGDPLPSMRLLAKELRISVITTKRAYENLENDGFIVSITGKGSYVASKNIEFIKEEHLRKIEEMLLTIIESANLCDIDLEGLIKILKTQYENRE